MNEEYMIDIDEDYMGDIALSTEFDWGQLYIDEKKSVDFNYENEDWLSLCF